MINLKKYIVATAFAAALATSGLSAQNTASGYFVDDYSYRFQLNPAFGNSKGFVSMPAIGNMNVAMNGNLHLKNVLFNVNGKTTTFLNPGVSVKEVMDGLSERNRIGSSVKVNILTVGFKAWGGYNTLNVNARADIGMKIPRSLFSFLKEGVSNSAYDISDFGAFANAYGEIALGHSRDITPEIRVGGALKFLVGGGNINARLKNSSLILGENDWEIHSNAEIEASVKGLTYETDKNSDTGHEYVNGANIDGAGINGFGMAVDLGAVYKPAALNDFSFSLAILDLGYIGWNNNMVASTNGDKHFNTDKYVFSPDDDAPNSFDHETDRIRDDISALYELENMGDKGSRSTMIGATMNVGVEYTLPVYRKLSFGLLNTTRIQSGYSWTDFRISGNIAPVKCFDASVNMGVGTFGCSFGWLANIHMTGLNLFVGMDHTLGKVTKQFVPLSSNASVNFGLNFMF